jgi:Lon protease-like protein
MADTDALHTDALPIFPLGNVLFPQGRMELRIFEARYMDLIARCMQMQKNFGICLIEEGHEVGAPAIPHKVGVEARIVDWDMDQPGLLGITVRGARRFRIEQHEANEQGQIIAAITWLAEPAAEPVSADHQELLPLLKVVVADAGVKAIPPPHNFNDANWVGYRYAEFLPIQPLARQRLLELNDADLRLAIIQEFLTERGVIK